MLTIFLRDAKKLVHYQHTDEESPKIICLENLEDFDHPVNESPSMASLYVVSLQYAFLIYSQRLKPDPIDRGLLSSLILVYHLVRGWYLH